VPRGESGLGAFVCSFGHGVILTVCCWVGMLIGAPIIYNNCFKTVNSMATVSKHVLPVFQSYSMACVQVGVNTYHLIPAAFVL
jgi:hypothetical protein